MSAHAVVIGMGQLGGVFRDALAAEGTTVHPVVRGRDLAAVANEVPRSIPVVITVGEDDLAPVLETLPVAFRDDVVLVQNELAPDAWERARIADPTVAVVWFEKKPGRDVRVVLPSLIAGRHAPRIVRALVRAGISAEEIPRAEVGRALLEKNVFILTTNLAGLAVGGTVGALLRDHRDLAVRIAREVGAVERVRTRVDRSDDELFALIERAIAADPDHACAGRTAPRRLARFRERARQHGIATPAIAALPSS